MFFLLFFSPFCQWKIILAYSCLLSYTIKPFKMGSTLIENICSCRSKFFPLRVDPIETGDKNETDKVASPESIPIRREPE